MPHYPTETSMFHSPIPTSEELALWFDRLAGVLSTYRLPADHEQRVYRQVGAAEFMLINIDRTESCGWVEARFKHTVSRNYLHVRYQAYSDVSYPVVPMGRDFCRGYFPAPVDIGADGNIATAK